MSSAAVVMSVLRVKNLCSNNKPLKFWIQILADGVLSILAVGSGKYHH